MVVLRATYKSPMYLYKLRVVVVIVVSVIVVSVIVVSVIVVMLVVAVYFFQHFHYLNYLNIIISIN